MAKFLLVDDSKVARNFLKSVLEEVGHEVVAEAANGLEGYDMYAKHQPDVVTLDIIMPLVGGIECLEKIMKNFPGANVIIVSSIGKESLVKQAMELGAKTVLVKPFDKDDAVKVINAVLK